MCIIATAKIPHDYNPYNVYFSVCLPLKQHRYWIRFDFVCCELLAFILYLCSLKQQTGLWGLAVDSCELLAFILYLCSLKQPQATYLKSSYVVNCLRLSCTFALWNNPLPWSRSNRLVVNCLRLSCTFALWNNSAFLAAPCNMLWIACVYLVPLLFETTNACIVSLPQCCELLAFILYLCSLKQPFCWMSFIMNSCELLAFILYLCSLKQLYAIDPFYPCVVNCLRLSCTFALWNNCHAE